VSLGNANHFQKKFRGSSYKRLTKALKQKHPACGHNIYSLVERFTIADANNN
jgi:hypothetical protein